MSKFKILCVDDDEGILDLYEIQLESLYPIIRTTSAEEALAILKNHQQEIVYVFSDFSMVGMDGLQFRAEMLALGIDIPFAVVTGNYDQKMEESKENLKINAIIEKPMDYESLSLLVLDLGEKRKRQLVDEREMVCSFISESGPMLEEMEGLILILEKSPGDADALNTYFRLLHTIKGTASCVGLKSLPKFTHKYEDLVSAAKEKKIKITPIFIDSLLYGVDRLKFMYGEITEKNIFEFEVDDWVKKLASFELCEFTEAEHASSKAKGATSADGHESGNDSGNESGDHGDQKKSKGEKLAIPLETLDSFLEFSGKLTILRNTIYKAISRVEIKYTNDKDVEILSSSIDELHKITSFVQMQISEMRKIGAEAVTRPLKRVVRDTSKDLHKEVELKINNENIKIDNTIAKIMANSLVHLVRNSIDHGIESPAVRKAANKNAVGTIELSFLEEGENNIIILQDDGAGINRKRVLAKAIEKKIVSEKDAKNLSSEEVLGLILEPGFSTAETVSSISGRGVGMDMVKSSVEAIGGKILIDSVEGQGSKFTLILPQPKNVLINKTLMVEGSDGFFSIPIDDVVEVVKITNDKFDEFIFNIGQYPVLKRYEELIPLFNLDNCLGMKEHKNNNLKALDEIYTIIIRYNHIKMGLVVDKVFDIEESVVRKIKPILNTSPIYTGVTYFGDDDLALVLNVENLTKENIKMIDKIKKETNHRTNKVESKINENMQELFTFSSHRNNYGIARDKVYRIEMISSDSIQKYYDNYFIKYRDSILKIVALSDEMLSDILNHEQVKIILMKSGDHLYGLYVDEVFEFVTSFYAMETQFSSNDKIKGSIIYQEKIIYIVDEIKLDKYVLAFDRDKTLGEGILNKENIIPIEEKVAA